MGSEKPSIMLSWCPFTIAASTGLMILTTGAMILLVWRMYGQQNGGQHVNSHLFVLWQKSMQLTCETKERRRLLTPSSLFAAILQWTCLKMKLEFSNNPIILLLRQGMQERSQVMKKRSVYFTPVHGLLLQELGGKQIHYIFVWTVQCAKIWPVCTASVTLLFHCAMVVIIYHDHERDHSTDLQELWIRFFKKIWCNS